VRIRAEDGRSVVDTRISGHFLCGFSRLSSRSIIATLTFFTTALITANTFPLPLFPTSKHVKTTSSPFTPIIPTTGDALKMLGIVTIMLLSHTALHKFLINLDEPNTTSPTAEQTKPQPPHLVIQLSPYFLSGLTFSIGLLLSGMSSPLKVLSFLQPLSPNFDPSLGLIVISGVIPNMIHYFNFVKSNVGAEPKASLSWEMWRVPIGNGKVNKRLICGAAIFGVGWGLAGACPGPTLVGLGQGLNSGSVWSVGGFFAAMVAGMGMVGVVS